MIFEQLNKTACKTYLIACERTKNAMLVDPVLEEVEEYLKTIESKGLCLLYVLDTHVHADHISGAAALRDRTGADYIMHTSSVAICANVRVDEGDTLHVGDISIKILSTPGHTQDSITLVLKDRILTGDFLFIGEGGAGRTDLPGGDSGNHWDSLQKLADFSNEMMIFPGHDYHKKTHSTLGQERKINNRLLLRPKQSYIDWLNDLRLGPATWMKDVINANYACAQDPRAAWIPVDQPSCEVQGTKGNINTETVTMISPQELQQELKGKNKPFLLDVRQPEEFNGSLGHIEDAHLLPVGEIAKQLESLKELQLKPIVTICRTGARSATAAAILSVDGFLKVRSLSGGMLQWNELGFPTKTKLSQKNSSLYS